MSDSEPNLGAKGLTLNHNWPRAIRVGLIGSSMALSHQDLTWQMFTVFGFKVLGLGL